MLNDNNLYWTHTIWFFSALWNGTYSLFRGCRVFPKEQSCCWLLLHNPAFCIVLLLVAFWYRFDFKNISIYYPSAYNFISHYLYKTPLFDFNRKRAIRLPLLSGTQVDRQYWRRSFRQQVC